MIIRMRIYLRRKHRIWKGRMQAERPGQRSPSLHVTRFNMNDSSHPTELKRVYILNPRIKSTLGAGLYI